MTAAPQNLLARWTALMERLGASGPDALVCGMNVIEAYQQIGRAYHNETHLRDVLQKLDWARTALLNSGEVAQLDGPSRQALFDTVELALWYHDAIYDAKAKDNEAQSSRLLRDHAQRLGISPALAQQASALVDLTAHHTRAQTLPERIMADCDLAILGAGKAEFAAYDANIRREYAHVPAPLYKQGRAQVLKGFLAQDPIFKTQAFRDACENAAKENLKRATAGFSLKAALGFRR